jgi:hypothetical protein
MVDAATGGYVKPVKITFGALADDFLAAYSLRHDKASTLNTIYYILDTLKKSLGGLPVDKISACDCQNLASAYHEKYKPQTLRLFIACLKQVFKYAIKLKRTDARNQKLKHVSPL